MPRTGAVLAVVCAGLLGSGCVPTRFEAAPSIPAPLVTRIPIVVGLYMDPAFAAAVHEEKREGASFSIHLGKAQADGFQRLMNAMFDRVVPVASTDAGARTDPEIRGVLEPVMEEFAFITPGDSGTSMYAVSIRYRINAYTPFGELRESWTFTGYGTEASSGIPMSGRPALEKATARAMRDAGARLAAEFREQAIARGLLPEGQADETIEIVPQAD
ncbi:MAG TPA: hypothetical protein VLM41_03755 [Steroidobacteraceae bacterium]|nr:hypothetical protein [Steroidobacteraceae bacterium]